MTTVNVSQVPATPVDTTWANASSAWNSVYATSSWSSARDPVAFTADIGETLTTAESISNVSNFVRAIDEAFAVAESRTSEFTKPIGEAIAVAESISNITSYVRALSEAFAVAETIGKDASKFSSESVAIAESRAMSVSQELSESVAFAESVGRVATFNKAIAEGFTVAEASAKAIGVSKSEALSLTDQLLQNSNATISDILVGQTDITNAEFDALLAQANAIGYGDFVPFMEGDQNYKNAIFKVIIQASNNAIGRITSLSVNIDVPDVNDSGTATIPSSGTTINFNRNFNAPPEMKVTLKGGTIFAIPRVSAITETGFFVELFNSSGVLVSGDVTWSAHGY